MDRREALNTFVKANLRLLLSEEFPHSLFKRAKLDFFLDRHKNIVGVPRDGEIADHAIDYLIRNGVISEEAKLLEILSLPFFKKHIRDEEPFRELLLQRKSTIRVVDVRKLSEAQVRERVKKELTEEIIKEGIDEIEEAIERKREEYLSIPSVLDAVDVEEPSTEEETPEIEEQFVPWWKRLNLSADPFPSQEGLARIADDLYEKVVFKTPIFERYVFQAGEAPEELFKDTIFFGEFGSGKTTLFDYLRKPFINERVFNIYMQLYAERDFPTLLAKFKKKLFDGLCQINELLYDADPREWLKSSDFDECIRSLLEKFVANEEVKGVVIFVDDMHKNFDEFDTAMKFINNLQIFKAELIREIPKINIAFFIAGSASWENIIKNDPKFSGSYARHETMPPVTEEAAHEMLNRRLSTFATNPDSIKTIDLGFVKRIYRGLQNNKLPVTFRSFIRATLSEFEKGNFNILTVDPIHISKETLEEIRQVLESNKILRKKFHTLLFGGGIQKEENRRKSLELLVITYLQQGITEDSKTLLDNKFSFQRLARSGLVQKAITPTGLRWVLCDELEDQNRIILKRYNLSLEDYLTKTYALPAPAKAKRAEKINEELQMVDALTNSLTNKEARQLAKTSRDVHARIIEEMERFEASDESDKILSECALSLSLLTKALARFLGLQLDDSKDNLSFLQEFWREFWFCPGEISEFINQAYGPKEPKEWIWYACTVYCEAYAVLLNFFENEVDKSRYMMIPLSGLSSQEITQFRDIRELWAKNQYFEVADTTSRLIEKKLRTFLFNVFTLLYGDRENRLRRVDAETKDYILKNMRKDQDKDFGQSKNEFEQVNRGNYKSFMISAYGSEIGQRNWAEVFKQAFAPLHESDLKYFLDTFAEINIATSHVKESAFGAEQQTKILNYVLRSMDMVRKMNQTYKMLVEQCLYVIDTEDHPRFRYYFSLDQLKDKISLAPILVDQANGNRIASNLLRQQPQVSIDLQDMQFIQACYGISYREFMTIVARLIQQSPLEIQQTALKVSVVKSKGSEITLGIEHNSSTPIDRSKTTS